MNFTKAIVFYRRTHHPKGRFYLSERGETIVSRAVCKEYADCGHGRVEIRQCDLITDLEFIEDTLK